MTPTCGPTSDLTSSDFNPSPDLIRRPVVIGLGELLWDLLPPAKHVGGATANFAYHAGQLDAEGIVVSCIGQDALGEEMAAQLRERGLNTEGLRIDPDHPTGTVTVTKDAAGQPTYIIHTGVAWDFLPFDAGLARLAERADAVCYGTLAQRAPDSRRSIRAFLQATRANCLRVLDINLRQQFYDAELIRESLATAHLVKLNDEELPKVAALLDLPPTEAEAASVLLERYALRLVALTRGGRGSSLYTAHRVSHHPGVAPPAVVDTVGAGDAFTAALVCGLLRYEDLDRVHDRASRLASFVCSQPGATPETRAFLASLSPNC
jgi:fructokinase